MAGLAGTAAAPATALAQSPYPAGRNIRIIVPFAAGATTDITGRFLAEYLSAKWGTNVVVENIPGAGTNVGIDRVAKSTPDGTTLGIITPSIVTNPFLMAKMPYDPQADLMPLSLTVKIPNLLVVKKDLPVNTVAEFIAHLKANPGKLNFASSAAGSTIHLSGELFKRMTGTDIVHVAYRGAAPALNDLLAGHVDLMFGDLPTMISHAREGRVKGPRRHHRGTLCAHTGPADHCRDGARFRRLCLLRRCGTERHAARHRSKNRGRLHRRSQGHGRTRQVRQDQRGFSRFDRGGVCSPHRFGA